MTGVVQTGDPVQDFVVRVRREYKRLRARLYELVDTISVNCNGGRLRAEYYYGEVQRVYLDGREVDHTNIHEALELAEKLAEIAREINYVAAMITSIEYHDLPGLAKAIEIARHIGIEVPREAIERKKQLEQQLATFKEKLRELEAKCRELQKPQLQQLQHTSWSRRGYRDCEGTACPH